MLHVICSHNHFYHNSCCCYITKLILIYQCNKTNALIYYECTIFNIFLINSKLEYQCELANELYSK